MQKVHFPLHAENEKENNEKKKLHKSLGFNGNWSLVLSQFVLIAALSNSFRIL